MKTKTTVTIDPDLLTEARRFARAREVSLSQLIEELLRKAVTPPSEPGFAERWRGRLRPAGPGSDGPRAAERRRS